MSPSDIEVLIHCHVNPLPHPRREAPAVEDALADFKQLGLITEGVKPQTYTTTIGGELLVTMLCDTPFPTRDWIDPRKKS